MKELNIRNFNYFLKNCKIKKENSLSSNKKTNIDVIKSLTFHNYSNKKRKNIRKINNLKQNKHNKYVSDKISIDITSIIKRVSKSVAKEKLKAKSIKERNKMNKKGKSASVEKIKYNNRYYKEQRMENKDFNIKQIQENNSKKINIRHIEINEMDLIIGAKKSMRFKINDSSNITLPPLIYSKPLFKYNEPIMVGLNNLGFTCYINAILQCLNQTEPLTNYFLSEEGSSKVYKNNIYIKDPSTLQLTPSYLEVIKNLWDTTKNNQSYTPFYFHQKLVEMNKTFKLNKPNDSRDLLKFILKQFHKELNTKNSKINDNKKKEFSFDQYDRIKTFNNFLKDFTYNNCSIISNYFYGINEINIECLKCKDFFLNQGIMINSIIYEFKIYNMLNFPLEEVKNSKINKNNNNGNINKGSDEKINIYDCFDYYITKKYLNEKKKIFCKRCNQLNDCIISCKLFNAPNILILILNRGKKINYNIKIDFYEEIELTNYIQFKQDKVIYYLYGVVTHIGKNGEDGHFIASCKNIINNLWYKYNDSTILKVKDFQKEVLDFGTPYILFYRKI